MEKILKFKLDIFRQKKKNNQENPALNAALKVNSEGLTSGTVFC